MIAQYCSSHFYYPFLYPLLSIHVLLNLWDCCSFLYSIGLLYISLLVSWVPWFQSTGFGSWRRCQLRGPHATQVRCALHQMVIVSSTDRDFTEIWWEFNHETWQPMDWWTKFVVGKSRKPLKQSLDHKSLDSPGPFCIYIYIHTYIFFN